MRFLLAPYPDYLRHNTGKIGTHDASIQSSRWTPGNNVYNTDMEFSHVNNGSTSPVGTLPQSEATSASRKFANGRIHTHGAIAGGVAYGWGRLRERRCGRAQRKPSL